MYYATTPIHLLQRRDGATKLKRLCDLDHAHLEVVCHPKANRSYVLLVYKTRRL